YDCLSRTRGSGAGVSAQPGTGDLACYLERIARSLGADSVGTLRGRSRSSYRCIRNGTATERDYSVHAMAGEYAGGCLSYQSAIEVLQCTDSRGIDPASPH